MGINLNNLDEAAKVVGGRKKQFLTKAFEGKDKDFELKAYLLYKDRDEITPEYVHGEQMYMEGRKPFPGRLLCNSKEDKNAPCVACQRHSKDGYKTIQQVFQFYVPETDTIYLWTAGLTAIKTIDTKLQRKLKKGKSVLQIPFLITRPGEKGFDFDIDELDDVILDTVQAAYDEKFPDSELYVSLTNEQMEDFYDNNHKLPDTDEVATDTVDDGEEPF